MTDEKILMPKKFGFLKGKVREYIKFNIVGTSNFAICQLFYLTLFLVFKINYLVAYTMTSVISISASYFFNSRFTFRQKNYSVTKFSLTFVVYLFEYMFNMSIILFLVNIIGISEIIAPIVAPVFSTIPVFFLMRYVIRKQNK